MRHQYRRDIPDYITPIKIYSLAYVKERDVLFTKYTLLMGTAIDDYEIEAVENDLSKMQDYLMSPGGGGWVGDEIFASLNESRYYNLLLIDEIRRKNPDFFILYWSGHGKTIEDQQIFLYGDDTASLGEVCGVSKRQLVVLDTCREVNEEPEVVTLESDRIFQPADDMELYRQYYEKCIDWCEPSLQIAFACQPNDYAFFDDSGGTYSSVLIKKAESWSLLKPMKCGYKSVKTLMGSVKMGDQVPSYFHSNQAVNRTNFPFSVRLATKEQSVPDITARRNAVTRKSIRL